MPTSRTDPVEWDDVVVSCRVSCLPLAGIVGRETNGHDSKAPHHDEVFGEAVEQIFNL
jgi:hypothetical protein